MKLSSKNRNSGLTSDLTWIVLALAIGISGQLFLLNPIEILTPKLPMLSHQDWPSSQVASELQISENWQWPKGREFFIRMQITEKHRYDRKAEIWQKTTWYDDSTEPATAAAYRRKSDFSSMQPIAENPLGEDKPASVLFCRDDVPILSCTYLAYWGHWSTEVNFWSEGDKYLSSSEMQRIIARVDQLLMEAPDRP